MEFMVDKLHFIIKSNNILLNMDGVDMSKKFNHYLVILYYAGVNLKENSSLGFHSNCVYSPINDDFVTSSNSQAKNKSVLIYSIVDSRNLRWKRGNIELSNTGHSK